FTVEALAAGHAPMPGTPAPRSRNLVVTDVADLRTLDSSDPPDPRLHQQRIADAIIQGKPQVIEFATPKYCTSRVCGPVVDVVRTLIPVYGDRVVFIHQEIWQAGMQTFAPTVKGWKLRSEPWIFVVDGGGTVRARFEGLTTRREIEAALRRVLGPWGEPPPPLPRPRLRRIDDDEVVAVRHLHLRQGLRVHLVGLADDAVLVQQV